MSHEVSQTGHDAFCAAHPLGPSSEVKRVLIVAGEASGDAYGGDLIRKVHQRNTAIQFFGIGGQAMHQAGAKILHDCKELAVVGFVEVIRHFGVISRAFNELKRILQTSPPDLVILIDYPGFNLRLAALAKKAGIPVLYYISPQIWAWKKGRIKKIKRIVDHMAVILPFEAALYEQEGIPVTFVGHPLLDMVQVAVSRDVAVAELGLHPDKPVVGLFPGSRKSEIARMLPVLVEAARRIRRDHLDVQFVLPVASTLSEAEITPFLGELQPAVKLTHGAIHTVMRACDAIASVSGTVTLEIALVGTPQVIMYRLASMTYAVAKRLVKVPFIGLCNIVAGEQVAKELIQDQASPDAIADEIQKLVYDEVYRKAAIQKLSDIRVTLGKSGAHERLADLVLSMV